MQLKNRVYSTTEPTDSRITVSFKRLFGLQSLATGFSFASTNNAGTVMAGRHQSKFRGRGMNFEELRNYQKGDDIRTLDWRVTLRTGKPHVRAYTEEKDHQIVLCIDLRKNLFFSSVDTMKSVVVAEIAALCIWRVLNDNDRIGALVLTDDHQFWFKPQRSQYQAIKILRVLAKQTHLLASAESLHSSDGSSHSLADFSKQLLRNSSKNAVYIFISDFLDFDQKALSAFKKLKVHNNILPVVVNDPLDRSLSSQKELVITDGKWQLKFSDTDDQLNERYEELFEQRYQSILKTLRSQDFPILTLSTDGQHISQFRRYLGAGQ